MVQHHHTGEDADDADNQLQAPQGRVKEDADDPQDALDQQVETQDPNQKDKCGTWGYQQKDSEDGGKNPLQENQPPGKGSFTGSRICRCRHLRLLCRIPSSSRVLWTQSPCPAQ
jgi:hypothetical protein